MCNGLVSDPPVYADGAEVKYGGGAKHHIHGHQSITYGHIKGPNSILELKGRKNHHRLLLFTHLSLLSSMPLSILTMFSNQSVPMPL